ncbi:apolipoprotein N-acyltransferase [Desulfobacterales bacterium HSG2]|nr:apolipoprotein N-acyltransferase [Desulfobacterales bacterium HSG2]
MSQNHLIKKLSGLNTASHRFLSPIVSGTLLILASPDFDLFPLAFIGLIPLYLSIRDARPLQAAAMGWLMGFVFIFGGSLWWVPLLENFANLPRLSSIGLTIAICAYQALTYLLWGGICSLLARRCRLNWLIIAPFCIVIAETAIPFIFKTYLAITVWRAWPLIQIAEIGGPPAVSALIVSGNLIIAEAVPALRKQGMPGKAAKIGAAVFVFILILGWIRAGHIAVVRKKAAALQVGMVQPNFGIVSAEERKINGDKYIRALRRASVMLAEQNAELIVWPESSWPYLFDRQMKQAYPPGHPWELRPGVKGRLLFGALTHTFGGADVYNSAVLVSESRAIAGRYDKTHLVPFAEYIPFGETFPQAAERCRTKLPDWPDIVSGESPQILCDDGLHIGMLICSEDMNMNFAHEIARQKPNLLVSIASDAWFGESAAARQHLALASFRAVETRRDFIRCTNTGVSVVIDALGRVKSEGPLIDVPVNEPQPAMALMDKVRLSDVFAPGPYVARFFPYGCLVLLVAIISLNRRSKRSAKSVQSV